MTEDGEALRLEGVHKSYEDLQVLKGIDLSVADHEVICLIGASGSGKSTMLKCVNLLEPINQGRIFVEGEEITAMEAEQPRAQVIDLMEALKASLASPQRKPAAAAKVARLPLKSDQNRKAPKAAPRNAKVVAKASRSSR